jgi:hypothetical protein
LFKGRIEIWIIVLVICILTHFFAENIPIWVSSEDVCAEFETMDKGLSEILVNKKIKGYKIVQNNDRKAIVFADSNTSATKDGYKKESDLLYSPIVCYFRNSLSSYNEGFINEQSIYRVDLYQILVAIENNKSWQDIGFHKNVVNGAVTLYIPEERCWYYKNVEELFFITINNGKVPTEEERVMLKPRVDAIVSKCNKVIDVGQSAQEEYNDGSKTHKVFVGPEFLYNRTSGMSTGSNSSFAPVYCLNTTFVSIDVYIDDSNDSATVGKRFVEMMQNKKDFMHRTGWRVKNAKYDIADVCFRFAVAP